MSASPPDQREQLQNAILDLFDNEEEEEEDDAMYETTTDGSTLDEDTEADSFTDAHESLTDGDIEIVFEETDENDEEPDDDDDAEGEATETEADAATTSNADPTPRPADATTTAMNARRQRTMTQLQALLGGHDGLSRILARGNYRIVTYNGNAVGDPVDSDRDDDVDDEDDDDDDFYPHRFPHRRPRRRRNLSPNRFPKIPNPSGRQLMESGVFGTKDSRIYKSINRNRTISERLLYRKLGMSRRPTASRCNKLLAQEMLPNTTMSDSIIHYDSRAYSGQFSDDGNFFFSCTQNFKVQLYDTSNPYRWTYYKTVDFPFGQWTITDATLSPDNRWLAYSSIRHTVCLAPTDPTIDSENSRSGHTLLDFTNYAPGALAGASSAGYMGHPHRQGFGIWSLRFSGDGREIVAGTSDHSVLVYDLERRQTTLKLRKHLDDVNAVCFADKSSPHILFSGSDDQTLRVWDRRSMADGREAGVFVGHTEGITYVDSKGDGRYVLSNGKDQMMKLWDLRKMMKPEQFERVDLSTYTTNFDYRFAEYDMRSWEPNPHDCSVVTFRGHSVLKTLIRCHFSPPTSSNNRYVYSGSEDGKVYIWNLDGTLKSVVDVGTATRDTRPRLSNGGNEFDWDMGYNSNVWKTCVRDASWCPTAPVIAATSWNGWGMSTGTVSVHSWNDSTFHPSSTPSKSATAEPGTIRNTGALTGVWHDHEDDGEPRMGQSYNARLEPRMPSRAPQRGWARGGGRGLRSNPVRRVAGDEENEGAGAGW